jgi:hypothetical protein
VKEIQQSHFFFTSYTLPFVVFATLSLEKELQNLIEQAESYQKQKEHFEKLYVWSQGVVKAVQWLESHLEAYCNSLFSGL